MLVAVVALLVIVVVIIFDELGVLLDEVLEAALLEVLELVLLEVASDLGAAPEGLALRVLAHGERAASRRLPQVLLVVVALRGGNYLVGDEVRQVEADADLAKHVDIGARRHGLHEGFGAAQLRVDVERRLVGEQQVANLVESIQRVGDQLAEEVDLLVGVEGVDDKRHEMIDLSLEGERLHLRSHGRLWSRLCVENLGTWRPLVSSTTYALRPAKVSERAIDWRRTAAIEHAISILKYTVISNEPAVVQERPN